MRKNVSKMSSHSSHRCRHFKQKTYGVLFDPCCRVSRPGHRGNLRFVFTHLSFVRTIYLQIVDMFMTSYEWRLSSAVTLFLLIAHRRRSARLRNLPRINKTI